MTPTDFVEFVGRTTIGSIDERSTFLLLKGRFADTRSCEQWRDLQAVLPPFVAAIAIKYAGSDEVLDEDETEVLGTVFDFVITKVVAQDELRLFFESTVQHLVDTAECAVGHVRIADLDPWGAFSTYRSRFGAWDIEPPPTFAITERLPDPRSYTKDFSSASLVASDLRPWLLRSAPGREGQAFRAWRSASCRRLVAAISDQVSGTSDEPNYHFSGPPTRVVRLKPEDLAGLFERMQSGAVWVFGASKDADTRHLFLASEWARTWQSDAPQRFGKNALESARSAYSAYVKSGSKETLKALTDLRKAVAEETQKISQRASDLAGAIWKDLAVAGVPFLVKFLPDSAKTTFPYAIPTVAIIAAIFLGFSFTIQTWINRRFFERQESSRLTWKEALGGVLSADEVAGISDQPISASIEDYNSVRNAVGLVYLALVFTLLAFALQNLEHPLATGH